MRTLISSLLALIAVNCFSQNNSMVKYYCVNGDFSILSSGKVETSKIPQTGNGKSYNIYTYSFTKNTLDLSASYYPIVYPPKGIANENSILLDNMVQGAASNSSGKVTFSKEIKYKTYPGREYTIELPDGYMSKCRMYIIERGVYQLAVVAESKSQINSNSSLIETFLNSFSKGENTSQSIEKSTTTSGKKSPELTVGDLESYALSSKNTVTFDMEGRDWKYIGTHNLEAYGTGYQYVYNANNVFSQIICYLDKNAIMYVPDPKFTSNLINQIKNKYAFVRTQKLAGSKQDVYRQNKFTIYVTYSDKNTFTLAWNVQ